MKRTLCIVSVSFAAALIIGVKIFLIVLAIRHVTQ
jgi:hypothetical protein